MSTSGLRCFPAGLRRQPQRGRPSSSFRSVKSPYIHMKGMSHELQRFHFIFKSCSLFTRANPKLQYRSKVQFYFNSSTFLLKWAVPCRVIQLANKDSRRNKHHWAAMHLDSLTSEQPFKLNCIKGKIKYPLKFSFLICFFTCEFMFDLALPSSLPPVSSTTPYQLK